MDVRVIVKRCRYPDASDKLSARNTTQPNTTKVKVKQTGTRQVAIAGGVSANQFIRKAFKDLEKEFTGLKIYMPDMKLCTDNAAMIASAGYFNYIKGNTNELDLNAVPNLKI